MEDKVLNNASKILDLHLCSTFFVLQNKFLLRVSSWCVRIYIYLNLYLSPHAKTEREVKSTEYVPYVARYSLLPKKKKKVCNGGSFDSKLRKIQLPWPKVAIKLLVCF